MDGGLIVQMGTHAQLLADRDGLYRRLCARQFGEPAIVDQAIVSPVPRSCTIATPHNRHGTKIIDDRDVADN